MRVTALSHIAVMRIKYLIYMKGLEQCLTCGISYYYSRLSTTLTGVLFTLQLGKLRSRAVRTGRQD